MESTLIINLRVEQERGIYMEWNSALYDASHDFVAEYGRDY